MSIGRRMLGLLGGVIAASVVIAATEFVGHSAVEGDNLFAIVVLGYGLGALAGTTAATWLSDRVAGAVVPIILGVLSGINLFAFPHPGWFAPAALAALALGWFVGSRLGPARSGTLGGRTS
jgi:hypothetical protein